MCVRAGKLVCVRAWGVRGRWTGLHAAQERRRDDRVHRRPAARHRGCRERGAEGGSLSPAQLGQGRVVGPLSLGRPAGIRLPTPPPNSQAHTHPPETHPFTSPTHAHASAQVRGTITSGPRPTPPHHYFIAPRAQAHSFGWHRHSCPCGEHAREAGRQARCCCFCCCWRAHPSCSSCPCRLLLLLLLLLLIAKAPVLLLLLPAK
jgi:hypothetical protein